MRDGFNCEGSCGGRSGQMVGEFLLAAYGLAASGLAARRGFCFGEFLGTRDSGRAVAARVYCSHVLSPPMDPRLLASQPFLVVEHATSRLAGI